MSTVLARPIAPGSGAFIALIAGMMTMTAMTIDINLPAIPITAAELGGSLTTSQLTVTIFFVGFAVAGHYQLDELYSTIFWFATLGNAGAIVIALIFWRTLADRDTPLTHQHGAAFWRRFAAGAAVLVGLVPLLAWLLQHPGDTAIGMKALCAAVGVALFVMTARHPVPEEKRRMQAYLVLTPSIDT